jgi:lysophospholipase L1-like esterase
MSRPYLLLLAAFVVASLSACSDSAPATGGGGSPTTDDASHPGNSSGGRGGSSGFADASSSGGAAGTGAGGGGAAGRGGGAGGASVVVDARIDVGDARAERITASDSSNSSDVVASDATRVDGGTVEELIHYYGRWNRLNDRAITVNTGSHVVAEFSGTAVTARFDVSLNQTPNPTLAWQIDQGTWQEGELAATVPLGTGLTSGTHEVFLMVRGLNENQARWTPPLVSSITFQGFDITGGALVSSPRPVRPKIEFLGDSITEGINLWTTHNGQTTPCWRSDGRLAYASQTSQLLGAEWRQVGFGRQGLTVVGNGGVPIANDSFNFIYSGVPRDSWLPDMVVINEGTNDSGANATAFRTAYTAYVTTIRRAYPAAKIVIMRPFNGTQAAPIQAEVDARHAAGDARVFYVDTTGWLAAADFTDGVHPNSQGSVKAAQALSAALATIGLP